MKTWGIPLRDLRSLALSLVGGPCKAWNAAVGPSGQLAVFVFQRHPSKLGCRRKPKTAGRLCDQLHSALRRRRDYVLDFIRFLSITYHD